MMTSDEAMAVGCRKYRELYPEGLIPSDLEEHGVLGSTPGDSCVTVHVTFWFEGESEPFYLFRASVDRESGDISVMDAADWHILEKKRFTTSQSL